MQTGNVSKHKKVSVWFSNQIWRVIDFPEVKKQSNVSKSSAKAEYKSMTSTILELVWVTTLLKEMGAEVTLPDDAVTVK